MALSEKMYTFVQFNGYDLSSIEDAKDMPFPEIFLTENGVINKIISTIKKDDLVLFGEDYWNDIFVKKYGKDAYYKWDESKEGEYLIFLKDEARKILKSTRKLKTDIYEFEIRNIFVNP